MSETELSGTKGGLTGQEKRQNVIRLVFDGNEDEFEALCERVRGTGVVLRAADQGLGARGSGLPARLPLADCVERVEQHDDVEREVVADVVGEAELQRQGEQHHLPDRQP